MGKRLNAIIFFSGVIFLTLVWQNCGNHKVLFSEITSSKSLLSVDMSGDGVAVDGKPDEGSYCRLNRSVDCEGLPLQGLVRVDESGIHLEKDNCRDQNIKFGFADGLVQFRRYNPAYLRVGQGVFQRCVVEEIGIAVEAEVNEVLCRSAGRSEGEIDVAVSSDGSGQLKASLFLEDGRAVSPFAVQRRQELTEISYVAEQSEFSLSFSRIDQEGASRGTMRTIIDKESMELDLECQHANSFPAITVERDLEIHPSWINVSGLVGYWKLNGPLNSSVPLAADQIEDSSGFGHHGTASNATASFLYQEGPLGESVDFSGVNEVIGVPSTAALDDMARISVTAWVHPRTGGEGTFGRIVDKTLDAAPTNGWAFFIWDGPPTQSTFGLQIAFSTRRLSINAIDNVIQWDRWQHVAFVWNGSLIARDVQLFINGERAPLTNDIDGIGVRDSDAGQPLRIGENEGFRAFDGMIDEVSVWNRMLTPLEIREIYQRGATGL